MHAKKKLILKFIFFLVVFLNLNCKVSKDSGGLGVFLLGLSGNADNAQQNQGSATITIAIPDTNPNVRNLGNSSIRASNPRNSSIITKVTLNIKNNDNGTTIVQDLVKSGFNWQGTIGGIPSGSNFLFSANAYDNSGKMIFQGEVTGVEIKGNGQTCAIHITLQQSMDLTPSTDENHSPVINSVVASKLLLNMGEIVNLQVDASDSDANDHLSYIWSSSGGTFINPSNMNIEWMAPAKAGTYTIQVKVIDSKQLSATSSLTLNVKNSCQDCGGVPQNTAPVISRLEAASSTVNRGESSEIRLSVSDKENDVLTYEWTSSCGGVFNNKNIQNPIFITNAETNIGSCNISVLVLDSHGASVNSTLTILITNQKEENLPPIIITSFISSPSAYVSNSLIFRIIAKDPESSNLTFQWKTNSGTLCESQESTTSNGIQSEVKWKAPDSIGSASLSVIVQDATGLSTTFYFNEINVLNNSSGPWTISGSMSSKRILHTSTLMQDGRVLVAGGLDDGVALSSVEIYNPITGEWKLAASMTMPRHTHSANLLNDGRILVVGGYDDRYYPPFSASSEIYDPRTDRWSKLSDLRWPRIYHSATLLSDGRVLVAGGVGAEFLVEIFDPSTQSWIHSNSMLRQRYGHTATLLKNGKLLIVGGIANGSAQEYVELYSPDTDEWVQVASPPDKVSDQKAVLLESGEVIVVGGVSNTSPSGFSRKGFIYDPARDIWKNLPNLAKPIYNHTATLLSNGSVIICGGDDGLNILKSVQIYNPSTKQLTSGPSMMETRSTFTATRLLDGRLLLIGGGSNTSEIGSF